MGSILDLRRCAASTAAGLLAWTAAPVAAAPVICTTTLEAPPLAIHGNRPMGPVEVTRCGVVESTDALMDRRASTYRSSFARGVSLTHQITDLFGIAMGGVGGNRIMGLGFPDQAIVWDGSSIGNTTEALLEEQSAPIPWRSGDLPNQLTSSLQAEAELLAPLKGDFSPDMGAVRGLW
ncbi:Occludin/ELL family protein [Synechococcus sp. CS-602]|uniref:hypothetical protein n=1 Tax=Synechococcaceae TaxID=1890426 RepID=UPI0008FF5C21|nr:MULTISPECIES: hypothetical protein [Synechococcaceae]MCT4364984.1 Occludin/ELL family protein [Candidatus Regnicoccus frigidus MAG-AL1]APD47853.1 hypothetical protein BM449_05760 [Synechococcus sp. SynAce01]MCT0205806.1 Occludin/ELL family protein [Synechococcus sp. CS-602]MCT0245212.1 Occludin/ELL family protein [Synechococcus sp. CS-601]MCT4367211.1 Occludin/ELL family protein [Candidatus Regnicoccus frigidus MAG-AL2]